VAHDWLEVTALELLPLLPVLEDVPAVVLAAVLVLEFELVVVFVFVFELAVWLVVWVTADLVLVWLASAGSWPVTSIKVIKSQVATNNATAPAITRWRIARTRAARAARMPAACAEVMEASCARSVATP
jgi:hypothetical protein